MGRLLTAIFMLFLTGVALAQTGAQSFSFSLTPPASDRSVAYLGLIFGTVGNVLHGGGTQILGQMFAVFNKGVMVVAALWLAMTTVQIVLRSAAEGSFLGQNKSVHLVFLRVSLGFALIIPSSSTGYSLLQDIFMKVVVSGVALADRTWDAALNYMNYGGQLYIPPTSIANTPASALQSTFFFTTSGGQNVPAVATQIFQNEVCMLRSGSQAWNGGSGSIQYTYDIKLDPANGFIYFPGSGNQDLSTDQYDKTTATCGYVQSYCVTAGNCGVSSDAGYSGSVNMSSASLSSKETNGDMEWNYAWLAMKQLVISLMPAAENYVAQYGSYSGSNYTNNVFPTSDPSGIAKENARVFFTAISGYGNLMIPLQNLKSSNSGNIPIPAAGWITAGGFYWDIEQSNKASGGLSAANLVPTAGAPITANLPNPVGVTGVNPAAEMTTAANESVGNAGYTGYFTDFSQLWAAYTNTVVSQSAANEESHQNSGGIIMEIIMAILGGGALMGTGVGVIMQGAANSTASSLGANATAYNPIAFLMVEGNMIIQFVASAWSGALLISVVLGLVSGICNSTSPGGLMFKAILTWIKSIFMMLTTVMLVPGLILSFYVPMYPFAVFTFAVVGWIMMVVEGMAAAPLICVGVTHPEGHDFLGKGEQALMFFLGIFVRPALLIVGLIASMLVSFVAFQILLAGFGRVWGALPTLWSASLAEIFIVFINFIMGLVVFAGFTMEIVEQSYKLTYQLPQYVMKWIGGPEMGQDYGQMASQLKSTVQAGGGAVKEGLSSANQAEDTRNQAMDKAREKGKGGVNV